MQTDPESEKVHLFGAHGKRWKRLRAINSISFNVSSLKGTLPMVQEVK